jgi:hypothetical protein
MIKPEILHQPSDEHIITGRLLIRLKLLPLQKIEE